MASAGEKPAASSKKEEAQGRTTSALSLGGQVVPHLQDLSRFSPEVTKVRRNLFNQELLSPSKKARMSRSHSGSAVEGLKRKRSHQGDLADPHHAGPLLRGTLTN